MDFELEYAKSNRAACKVCKEKIAKDALRVGAKLKVDAENTTQMTHMMESVRWHHFQCFPKMKRAKWFAEHLQAADTCAGFGALKPEDQEKVTALFAHCRGLLAEAPEPPAAPLAPDTPEAKKGGRKRPLEAGGEGGLGSDEQPSAQKAPKAACGFTEEQLAAFQGHKEELSKKNMAQLAALLARNGLPKSGRKEELVERVSECRVLGAPPQCPVCDQARLRWSRDTGLYSCPGHFDDAEKRMKRCKGPAKGVEIERPKWEEAPLPGGQVQARAVDA